MRRIPTRTLVLMVLTLVAFGWMYWQTHKVPPRAREPVEPREVPMITLPRDAGREELKRAVSAALAAAFDSGSLIESNDGFDAGVVQPDAGKVP